MDIAVIGPPGAGKGTHTKKIVAETGLKYVSTGGLLRDNLEKQTGLGYMAQRYMSQGEMVPNEVVNAMLVDFLGKVGAEEPLLFNGFPRTTFQAQFLDELFEKMGRRLGGVIYLKASDASLIKRLSDRLICDRCQAPFHKTLNPFQGCPYQRCTGEYLYTREDDNPRMARIRLQAYHRNSKPLIDYFTQTKRLFVVDSEGAIDKIDLAIADIVAQVQRGTAVPSPPTEIAAIWSQKQTAPLPLLADMAPPCLDLVFLGPPGAGKGTHAAHISQQLKIPRIATGDLFRENIRQETELGKVAKSYIDHGKLVPDDVTEAMVRERLSRPDVDAGFILDGFPRNLPQAEALGEILTSMRRRIAGVLYLNVSDEEIVKRLSGRQLCRECQRPFHQTFNPFQTCPYNKCEGQHLYQREDDKPATVRERLTIYHGETEPLVDYYRKSGLLLEIDGEGELPMIREVVMSAIDDLRALQPG